MSTLFLVCVGFDRASLGALKGYRSSIEKNINQEVLLGAADEVAKILCNFVDKGALDSGAPLNSSVKDQHLFVIRQIGTSEPSSMLQFQVTAPSLTEDKPMTKQYLDSLTNCVGRSVTKVRLLRDKIYSNYSTSPFLLPFRNFACGDFQEKVQSFKSAFEIDQSDVASTSNLVDQSDSKLRRFRKPNRPATREKAFVDKLGRVQSYSPYDLHGGDPRLLREHDGWCVINGYFRFGCRINSQNHFDMYKVDGTSMRGSRIYNCHDEHGYNCSKFRANVWSSDFNIEKDAP